MPITKDEIYAASNGASVGETSHQLIHMITKETLAAVETDGALDELASTFTEGKGDVLIAVMDYENTVVGKNYVVTRAGTDITLTPFVDATA